jgi:hypothetical protein
VRTVTDPSLAILRGAGVPAAGVVLLTAAGFAIAGRPQAASVLAGGGIAMAALVIAPLIQRLTRRLDPAPVLGLAVLAYSVVVILVGLVYAQVNDASWLRGTPAAMGVLAAIIGWCTGLMRASSRLRQLLYDTE